MALKRTGIFTSTPRDNEESTSYKKIEPWDEVHSVPSSLSSPSSPPGPAAQGNNRRFTPDTGSEDDSDEEDEVFEKDGSEEYELSEGVRGRREDEESRSSGEHHISRSRRRRRPLYTAEEEKNVVRKFDRKLVVFVAILYLLAFLDRSSTSFIFLSISLPIVMETAC